MVSAEPSTLVQATNGPPTPANDVFQLLLQRAADPQTLTSLPQDQLVDLLCEMQNEYALLQRRTQRNQLIMKSLLPDEFIIQTAHHNDYVGSSAYELGQNRKQVGARPRRHSRFL